MYGCAYLFGDNESVIKCGSLPHSQLTKRWHALAHHYARGAVASKMVSLHHAPSELNPADVLSKHWGHQQVWRQLQGVLFWQGNPAEPLDKDSNLQRVEGSDKVTTLPSGPAK